MSYKELEFKEEDVFLVTGGAGFIGSNLCQALLEKNCKVKCLDDLSTGKQENVDLFLEYPNYEFILVGNENKIKETLTEDKHIANIKIHHAEDIITGDDEPVRAVRRKKDASMVVCARLVKDKEAAPTSEVDRRRAAA